MENNLRITGGASIPKRKLMPVKPARFYNNLIRLPWHTTRVKCFGQPVPAVKFQHEQRFH